MFWLIAAYGSYFFLCSFLVLIFRLFKQVDRDKEKRNFFVWKVRKPSLLYSIRKRRKFNLDGFSCGTHALIWIEESDERYDPVVRHEHEHCWQQIFLGPLMLILYLIFSGILYMIPGKHWHHDNPFEVAARNAEKKLDG